ncbi:hypothetical protein AO065_19755 [Pseudomonas viridiflava]|nr:hypothetical protein AAI_06513 [Pseudomonas viridiflava UASWS0038]KPL65376.1 hypothetical protein PVFL_06975 [Pseudomonas viridiflava]OAG90519.1 hypothetical protein AO065_19755 [Pseudomonas viridiflava]
MGAFLTSDHDRDNFLRFIDVDEVISLFSQVGNDSPILIQSSRDPNTGKAPIARLERENYILKKGTAS